MRQSGGDIVVSHVSRTEFLAVITGFDYIEYTMTARTVTRATHRLVFWSKRPDTSFETLWKH